MARVWKARMGQTIVGSNPTLSANKKRPRWGRFFVVVGRSAVARHGVGVEAGQYSGGTSNSKMGKGTGR